MLRCRFRFFFYKLTHKKEAAAPVTTLIQAKFSATFKFHKHLSHPFTSLYTSYNNAMSNTRDGHQWHHYKKINRKETGSGKVGF